MNGVLLTYKENMPARLTLLNNLLFGRVVKVTRKGRVFFYYYEGELHNKLYYKLSKGCYFIPATEEFQQMTPIDGLQWRTVELDIKEEELYTAADTFRAKYTEDNVVNL